MLYRILLVQTFITDSLRGLLTSSNCDINELNLCRKALANEISRPSDIISETGNEVGSGRRCRCPNTFINRKHCNKVTALNPVTHCALEQNIYDNL
jgi:hypothetical protein